MRSKRKPIPHGDNGIKAEVLSRGLERVGVERRFVNDFIGEASEKGLSHAVVSLCGWLQKELNEARGIK